MEKLAFPFELQESEPEEGTFSGRAIVYGREFNTMFGPLIIEPGAFADSINRNRNMVILWQHSRDEPVGRAVELEDRPDGVHVKGRISQTTRGRDALTLLRDKVLQELSAGVERIEETDEKGKIRRLRKGEIHEISLVTFGAAGREGAKVYEVHNAVPEVALPLEVRQAIGYAAELEAKYGKAPEPEPPPPSIPISEIEKVCAPCGELFRAAGIADVEVEKFLEAMESLVREGDS